MYKNRSLTAVQHREPSQQSVATCARRKPKKEGMEVYVWPTHSAAQQKLTQHCRATVVGGLVTKLCPTLATPWTIACQAPLSMEFSRQEYWSGLPFPSPGDLPNPGIKLESPALQADSLLSELTLKQY